MSKFKTKARTIELLGRKQIRDSVTALAELMKNSYDADADWVRVYFNSNDDNIILVDNGVGMSKTDIEEKWLALGTPSKNTKKRLSEKGRPYMGAKGIGRLASARLGRHYIMITKKRNEQYNIVYLYWDLFEDTSIALEEIEIPTYYNLDKSALISVYTGIVNELVEGQLKNIDVYAEKEVNSTMKEEQQRSVIEFKEKAKKVVKYLGLIEEQGTLLFMSQLRDDWNGILVQDQTKLSNDLTYEKNYKRLANFVATLNSAYKRQEKCNRDFVEIFKNGNIMYFHEDYTDEDFNIYDIKFEGIINKGVFKGELFAKNTNHEALIKANEVLKKGIDVSAGIKNPIENDCGPIRVKICHIEGEKGNSSLSSETYEQIHEKIDVLGGIGIYRDGVKVLPYGEPENDYLEIERRRTSKAGVYVFSHRNIFGRIDISTEENPKLEDKSSREGFIENDSYQYFITVLKNLLVKIAMDFLSNARKNSFNIRTYMVMYYKQEKEKKKEQEECEKKEKEQYNVAIQGIKKSLEDAKNAQIEYHHITRHIADITETVQNMTGVVLLEKFEVMLNAMKLIEYRIEGLTKRCTVVIPQRFSVDISQKQPKLLQEIKVFNDNIQEKHVEIMALLSCSKIVFEIKEKEFEGILAQRRTAEEKIEILEKKLNNICVYVEQMYANIDEKQKELLFDIQSCFAKLNSDFKYEIKKENEISRINNIRETLKTIDIEFFTDNEYIKFEKQIDSLRESVEKGMDGVYKEFNNALKEKSAIVQKVNSLLKNKDLIGQDEQLIGSLKAKNFILSEEVDLYEDLANFGMASEILNHEFNQFYSKANDAILQLGCSLVDKNSRYWLQQIQIAFDAIYSRHNMLSPMYKIKAERAKNYSLYDVVKGTIKLFEHTFETEYISVAIDIDENVQVKILPSHFYPALSNVISNAVFWLTGKNDKKIYVHYVECEHALYIEDNGKGILADNKEDIFNPFYSLKPNGRGLGLTITKRVLQKDGNDIVVVEMSDYKLLEGACFKIIFK